MKTIALRVIDILTRIVVMVALVVSLFFNFVQYHSNDTWGELYDKQRKELANLRSDNMLKCLGTHPPMELYDRQGKLIYELRYDYLYPARSPENND